MRSIKKSLKGLGISFVLPLVGAGAILYGGSVAAQGAPPAPAQAQPAPPAQPDQFPVMQQLADKLVQRYQTASCEDIAARREQPKSQAEQQAVELLRTDPQMRAAFL